MFFFTFNSFRLGEENDYSTRCVYNIRIQKSNISTIYLHRVDFSYLYKIPKKKDQKIGDLNYYYYKPDDYGQHLIIMSGFYTFEDQSNIITACFIFAFLF